MIDTQKNYGILKTRFFTEANTPFVDVSKPAQWGFTPFIDTLSKRREHENDLKKLQQKVTPLKSGDLVTIFKSVSEGHVRWKGVVNLEFKQSIERAETGYKQQAVMGAWVHGLQENLPPEDWAMMFFDSLPTKLVKNGRIFYGALEPFSETGTEGIIWSMQDYNKDGYDGLLTLETGDELTVYDNVTNGEIEWQGNLQFHEQVTRVDYFQYESSPLHMAPEKWAKLCFGHRPVIIEPA